MKKLFLIFSLLTANFSYAQIPRGVLFLGPSLNFSQNRNASDPENSPVTVEDRYGQLNGIMRVGYFVADNAAIGLIGGYSNSYIIHKQLNSGNGIEESENTTTNIGSAGVFGRGYKLVNENKVGFFFQVTGVYQAGDSRKIDRSYNAGIVKKTEATGKITGYNIGLQPGVVYFITKKIGLECSFGNFSYNSLRQLNYVEGEKISTNTTDRLNINFALSSFYIGMNFYLD